MAAMTRRGLLPEELERVREIVARRDPGLVSVVDRLEDHPPTRPERERIRRAVVDELCELPGGADGRRTLELQELLIHLGEV